MPIYEYKCENGHLFDVIQKMSDEPLRECQECGAPASRVLSAPAIHFKGSGFHNTDYGTRKGGGNGGGSESSGESGESGGSGASESKSDAGKSESKSDSKPAASTAD